MAAKADNIEFNGKKKEMAEKLANPDFTGTIGELCKSVGIARSTFYKWTDDPEYRQYIDKLIEKYTDSELSAAWKALINRALSGDVPALKLYFELKGKYKQNVTLDGAVIISGGEDVAE